MNDYLLKSMSQIGTAICRLPSLEDTPTFALFSDPIFKEEIYQHDQIQKTFEKIEIFKKNGNAIVICVSYSCADAFDTLFKVKASPTFPLLSYMVYDHAPTVINLSPIDEEIESLSFKPELDFSVYQTHLDTIFDHLVNGNLYQANFTFQSKSKPLQTPERDFLIRLSQNPSPHSAFVHLENHKILSFSPELFLSFDGISALKSKPMKGTVKRALSTKEDLQAIHFLKNDIKNRAENLMIVDMVRNDFSKIKNVTNIEVDPIFEVESYPNVHQLVSTVHAKIPGETTLYSLFKALFPAASITGAPKINAVHILNDLEKDPRDIYTGSIGCVMPNGAFSFNVAIRTWCCTHTQTTLGVGGGIVYDSTPQGEWEEARLKQLFTQGSYRSFEVFETLFWDVKEGYLFLEEHLLRAQESQSYFSRHFNLEKTRHALENAVSHLKENHVVKVSFKPNGLFEITIERPRSLTWKTTPLKIVISETKTDSKNCFLYHKTTQRACYTQALKKAKKSLFDEVIFFNEHDELTEGSFSNIFLKIKGRWYTPKTSCGLLNGIARQAYIQQHNAIESSISKQQLFQAEKVCMINSVRGIGTVEKIEEIKF